MELPALLFSATAVLIAGVIRGYSGFGFSMIAVTSLTLVMPPAVAVPVILFLEITASGWLLPTVWRHIERKSLAWLFVGVLPGTFMGAYLLATIPERAMRAGIGLVVVILVVFIWRGFSLSKIPGKANTAATGLVSGLLNGAAAIGGPPVILFYFSSPVGAAVSRATIIAYFLGIDILAMAMGGIRGLITFETLTMWGLLLIPLLSGIIFGNRLFLAGDKAAFRRKVMVLLMLLATATLVHAALL